MSAKGRIGAVDVGPGSAILSLSPKISSGHSDVSDAPKEADQSISQVSRTIAVEICVMLECLQQSLRRFSLA
jgi:hypothetical protein